MGDLPYPTYDTYQKITPEQMALAKPMNFGPVAISGTKWEAVASVNDSSAYGAGIYKINLTKGYSYDISSSSFFIPFQMKIFDQFGNVVALGSDNIYSSEEDIWGFLAPYSGTYYIDASWNKGVYYTSATLSVYEDQNPVKVNHNPTAKFSFDQISWPEGVQSKYVIAANTFGDPDGDALTFSARANGASLPSWLNFDSSSLTFSGTPPIGATDFAVTVTAKDPGGLTASVDFVLSTPGLSPSLVIESASNAILRVPSSDLQVAGLVNQVKTGSITAEAAIAQMVKLADASTSVATLSYQFFTGKIPQESGITYLVSPVGSNSNNLNSAYYKSFNIENRYINFAVNLGKFGEGRAKFEGEYGSLTLEQATKKAYGVIFGAPPTDSKVTLLLGGGRDAYLETYGRDGHDGLGTKAAMVGWLLAEAEKADIGMYARSNAAFLTDIADGGNWAVDLVGVYGKPGYIYAS